jgi:hypothetical protein
MPDRFLDVTSGTAMVVTDLHGDWDYFDRCLKHFYTLYEQNQAHHLIFLGDVIHGYGAPDTDASLDMILEIIALREQYGPDMFMMLLGNHEMPHIYGVMLAKGDLEFTPRFEHALKTHRERVIGFFDSLPFIIRTAAGVMLLHAGPAPDVIGHVELLRHFDHQAVLDTTAEALAQAEDINALYKQYGRVYGAPYDEVARQYLAIQGPNDPRYMHLLRAFMVGRMSREFQILWDTLFSMNERGLTSVIYQNACQQFLSAFSVGAPVPQQVMVSGHIATKGGHESINSCHLRLASAAHARPRESGEYLLFDCAKPVANVNELLPGLRPVFG